jgi:hypothetical protein
VDSEVLLSYICDVDGGLNGRSGTGEGPIGNVGHKIERPRRTKTIKEASTIVVGKDRLATPLTNLKKSRGTADESCRYSDGI